MNATNRFCLDELGVVYESELKDGRGKKEWMPF